MKTLVLSLLPAQLILALVLMFASFAAAPVAVLLIQNIISFTFLAAILTTFTGRPIQDRPLIRQLSFLGILMGFPSIWILTQMGLGS